jgi:hypothetical protein
MKNVLEWAKNHKFLTVVIVLVSLAILGAVFNPKPQSVPPAPVQQTPAEQFTLNACKTDSANADYWAKTDITLFDVPGGVPNGAKFSGRLPSCQDLHIDVLDKQAVDGVDFYKVQYKGTSGWQTKRLLVGE